MPGTGQRVAVLALLAGLAALQVARAEDPALDAAMQPLPKRGVGAAKCSACTAETSAAATSARDRTEPQFARDYFRSDSGSAPPENPGLTPLLDAPGGMAPLTGSPAVPGAP
jgi:hypothetical protein